jgi:hypothetical protein
MAATGQQGPRHNQPSTGKMEKSAIRHTALLTSARSKTAQKSSSLFAVERRSALRRCPRGFSDRRSFAAPNADYSTGHHAKRPAKEW